MFISGNHAAAATDTPERLSAVGAGVNFNHGFLSLDASATGPARFGGSNVSVANGIGAIINPGETVPLYSMGAVDPYNTSEVYIAFTAHAAGDNIGWTVKKG